MYFRICQGALSLGECSTAVLSKRLNLCAGETPHGTRSACAIMLSHLGVDKEAIKAHVGWKTDKMFVHYTSSKQLSNKKLAAKVLSSTELKVSGSLQQLTDLYKDPESLRKVFN